jgi:hypothetical protein
MAQYSNFDEYMKTSVIDLTPQDKSKSKEKKDNLNYNFNPFITLFGSKLWVDTMLDGSYFMLNTAHAACLNFCYETNIQEHMSKIKEDYERSFGMACQANCLKKIFKASDLVSKAVEIHPYSTRHFAEFSKIEEEVRQFNDQALNKNI